MPFNICSKVCGVYHVITRHQCKAGFRSHNPLFPWRGGAGGQGWNSLLLPSHLIAFLHHSIFPGEVAYRTTHNSVSWWCKWWAHLKDYCGLSHTMPGSSHAAQAAPYICTHLYRNTYTFTYTSSTSPAWTLGKMLRRNGKSFCPADVLGETVSSRSWGKYST